MWDDLPDFLDTVRQAYRLDVWATQPEYLEVWLEKDALSAIFEDVLNSYGVTLNVGRGYDGWTSIKDAAARFKGRKGVTVLYFGDFDPSGEDMVRSLRERLAFFGCYPEVVKCALVEDDIERYSLPPDFTKATDSRRAAFVEKFGDVSVELDALPPRILRERLVAAVRARLDLDTLGEVIEQEERDKRRLTGMLSPGQ